MHPTIQLITNPSPHSSYFERKLSRQRQDQLVDLALRKGLILEYKRSVCCVVSHQILPTLTHQQTGSWFQLGGTVVQCGQIVGERSGTEQFESFFHPGNPHEIERRKHSFWENQLDCVASWMDEVLHQLKPDIWERLAAQQNSLLPIRHDESNAEFNPQEERQLHAALEEVQAKLVAMNNNVSLIQADISDLKTATGRLGRRDWKDKFLGVLMKLVISAGLQEVDAIGFLRWAWHRVTDGISGFLD